MLKHSIGHYGSTHVPLQTQHPLTSSSLSADTSIHQSHLHHQSIIDPTRFIEGPPSHSHHPLHHSHSHSKSYLDQSYPSIHNPRSPGYLESSRISRQTTKDEISSPPPPPTVHHHHLGSASKPMNGSIYFSPGQPTVSLPPTHLNETSNSSNITSSSHPHAAYFRHGVLRSLSLLSVLSLLLALNSLYFLLQIVSPLVHGGEMEMMYEVTLCLSAMCLSINLCVLLVTSAQYFFAVTGTPGSTSFLQKVTVTRGVAIGGFFLSIPLFLSAIVLYTFTHLTFSPPALIATACVGAAIIFGGCAMVHHVFTWQQEKTTKRISLPQQSMSPPATIELSTLV
ncbi:hypothetical protein Ocin01_16618 [Orchesella cincta]|uniref:Uncharacterized protein n=1 Tax=Orchesella cincta TaxID=48709 RepID=A0A1D2MAV1_ORCCI|nr:hypothetical protein Ocin01_16618 [Orchesella cincta]